MIYGQPVTFGGASGEIDITDNGTFDVKKYATANVNVEPVLLWTNASPTSAFASQTIGVNGNGYSGYLVEVRWNTSSEITGVGLVPIGKSTASVLGAYYGVAPAATRLAKSDSEGSIYFANGTRGSTDDTHAIPTRIWGVKFTL